jgi:flagellar assembly protein FliH
MAQKFTFQRAFPETPDRVVPLEKKEPTMLVSEHEKLMAMAVAAAREQAFVDGRAQGDEEATAQLARAMEAVSFSLGAVREELDHIHSAASDEAVRFAHGFAVSLAGRLMDAAPMAQIEDAARRIFEDLRGQPHAVVRVAAELADAARDKMQAVARERGFEGRLIVMGEPEIPPGDVRIEWADGGIVRDRADAERKLAEAVAQALAAGGRTQDQGVA